MASSKATRGLTFLLLTAMAVSANADGSDNAAPAAASLKLQFAPGPLRDVVGSAPLVLASDEKGRTLYLLSCDEPSLQLYSEQGEPIGKSVHLTATMDFCGNGTQMYVANGVLAVVGRQTIALFELDGTLIRSSDAFPFSADITNVGFNRWILAGPRLPSLNYGSLTPSAVPTDTEHSRVFAVDDDLEIQSSGLNREKPLGKGMEAVQRLRATPLKLAAGGDYVFAAEFSNYRIYQLKRSSLTLVETYEEPTLFFEKGKPDEPADEKDELTPEEVREKLRSHGFDPDDSTLRYIPPKHKPVVRDLCWDPGNSRLLILLAAVLEGGKRGLDILDPLTGMIERAFLELPAGLGSQAEISQLVVGKEYIWFRHHSGTAPTMRLPRQDLDEFLLSKLEEDSGPDPSTPEEGAQKPTSQVFP